MFRFKVLHLATATIGSTYGFLFGARQKNSFKINAQDPEVACEASPEAIQDSSSSVINPCATSSCGEIPCATPSCGAIPCATPSCGAIPCATPSCGAIPCATPSCGAIPYSLSSVTNQDATSGSDVTPCPSRPVINQDETPSSEIIKSKKHLERLSKKCFKKRFDRIGLPLSSQLIVNDDFLIMYDYRTLIASWVFEHLTKERNAYNEDNLENKNQKKYWDDLRILSPNLTVRYHNYGKLMNHPYTRGHLAQLDNHVHSKECCGNVNKLTNIAPQIAIVNRGPWKEVEQAARYALLWADLTLVLTVPLFIPEFEECSGKTIMKYEVVGHDCDIAVPTHFLKVISYGDEEDTLGTIGYSVFLLPNTNLTKIKTKIKNRRPSVRDLEEIRKIAGFEFMSVIGLKKKKKIK